MKLLRNVTAVTAAIALSAGAFALPAVAQDGSEQTNSENTSEGDVAVHDVTGDEVTVEEVEEADTAAATTNESDEDRDFAATDGDTATDGDILQDLTDAAGEALTQQGENAPVDGAETFQSEAAVEPAVLTELNIAEKMQEYIAADKKAPLNETWMTRVYNHKDEKGNRDWLERVIGINAYSPSMDIDIPLAVITPDGSFDESRPTIYMLNGAGGAEQGMDWITATSYTDLSDEENIVEFYKDKNVNVVIPQAGAFSYYTDWVESPQSGYLTQEKILWETFLTKELPDVLENEINGNGKRAIAGMSMSATSALVLAEHNPGFYNAVGSFSGCAATSRPFPNMFANLTVNRGGGNTTQMWGPQGGEYNVYNDGLVNANNLRESEVYVSANSGLPGMTDMGSSKIESQGLSAAAQGSSTLIIEGGIIEAAANSCTHDLKAKMDSQGIDADWNFRPTGTHSWPGWRKDLAESWPTFARGLGL
ncbi:alpha/beta hydrolase family protein [Corynebacterium sp.]|uniref:alpha/beta hydrolase n=1 Tax=Corynebacterium sp. TaxID=1720 RepID=UPI0028B032DD|nr:alpha/beta hydrolase family protein [Corynebacterium sp.]